MKLVVDRTAPYHYSDPATGQRFFSVSQVRNVLWPYVERENDEATRRRGTEIHLYWGLLLGSRAGLCPLPEPVFEYEGYCRALREAADVLKVRPIRIEDPSYNLEMGIAGQPDTLAWVSGPWKERIGLIDVKTGMETKTDGVQLMLYKTLQGYESAKVMLDLYVRVDGGFQIKERVYDPHAMAWALNGIGVLKGRNL